MLSLIRLILFLFLAHHLFSNLFFFFTDTAPTEIYTLSLHDALPILLNTLFLERWSVMLEHIREVDSKPLPVRDRKSTRLNSSHRCISYAVFCLKKKKKKKIIKMN